jgi:hypothetical protein
MPTHINTTPYSERCTGHDDCPVHPWMTDDCAHEAIACYCAQCGERVVHGANYIQAP